MQSAYLCVIFHVNTLNPKDLFQPKSADSLSSIASGADLTFGGAILSIWSKSIPIKTIAAPSKTVLAHRRNCFSHVMRIGPFHKSHFYSKNRDISGFSLVGPYLGLTWPILIELFRPHDNAKWLDH